MYNLAICWRKVDVHHGILSTNEDGDATFALPSRSTLLGNLKPIKGFQAHHRVRLLDDPLGESFSPVIQDTFGVLSRIAEFVKDSVDGRLTAAKSMRDFGLGEAVVSQLEDEAFFGTAEATEVRYRFLGLIRGGFSKLELRHVSEGSGSLPFAVPTEVECARGVR